MTSRGKGSMQSPNPLHGNRPSGRAHAQNTRQAEEGEYGGFRWSWDEVVLVLRRPFSSPDREGQTASESGRTPLFRWSRDGGNLFRWSFEDLKNRMRRSVSVSRSSGSAAQGHQHKRKRGNVPDSREFSGGNMGGFVKAGRGEDAHGNQVVVHPGEQFLRRETRKDKKAKQEAIRRAKVKTLFVQLGTMLGVENPESKGAKVEILAVAKEKMLSKKGLDPEQRKQIEEIFSMDLDLDMDFDDEE